MSWVTLEVKTTRRAQLVDITERLAEAVTGSGVDDGVCHVYVPHTTAGVTINEGADPDVARDIEARLEHLVPKEADYEDRSRLRSISQRGAPAAIRGTRLLYHP